ncbi:MAG TPA: pyridoxamine 5'-phosphate oxidase family protein [Polyangia bacterium]|nr:pyridoxamine 5'-phosphate oxidase family protein [Polyangia bacterium]
MPLITPELARFLEGPNSIIVATQDGQRMPECARGLLLRCPGGDDVTLWLPAAVAARTAANLAVEPRIAVAAELPSAHVTRQLKGIATRVLTAPDQRRALLDEGWEAFVQQCGTVGLPRRLLDRVVRWPVTEIHIRVNAVFDQTPGPGAGEPLGGAA